MSTITRPETRFIKVEEHDDVLYVTLDRPPLNVLTIDMMWELIGVLDEVASHQGALRAVVLRGAGKAFSAGVDIGEHQGETLRRMLDSFHTLMLRVLHCPLPTIAVVHGYALGGGCELASVSDMILIAEDAKIGVPEIKLAVFPPAAAVLFPRLIGTHRALELILTGEPVTGAEAARIGLANRAVPAAELDAALELLLSRLRATSGAALRITKRAVLGTIDEHVDHALDHLKWVQEEELIPSHDAQEGLKAFLEKRAPVWQHR